MDATLPRRTFLLATALAPLVACARTIEAAPLPAPPDVEITAVLDVPRGDVEGAVPLRTTIEGDGHAHDVAVDVAAQAVLLEEGKVVVRSAPGGPDAHAHWVRVRLT